MQNSMKFAQEKKKQNYYMTQQYYFRKYVCRNQNTVWKRELRFRTATVTVVLMAKASKRH